MSNDRIAVVTGAGRGLGLATAVALARRGTRVVATHRGAGAEEVVEAVQRAGGDVVTMELDIAEAASIEAFATALPEMLRRRWGHDRVDVLVNNAGVGRWGAVGQIDADDLDVLLGTNVRGTILLTQAMVPHLADGGAVVSLSSMLTRRVSVGTSAYAASKAAVETFSLGLASELGERGIRVNTVAPGPTATDFNGGAMRDDPTMREYLAGSTALRRVGDPDDIGEAVATLVEPGAAWITGQRIEVSGGALI